MFICMYNVCKTYCSISYLSLVYFSTYPSSQCAMCSKVISGVVEEEVHSVEDALGWLECGNAARVTSATEMNVRSSRSHAVFTVSMSKH